MKLKDWITSNHLTQREAAERIGCHEITLSRWVSGSMMPRRRQIEAIQAVTNGAVGWADFAPPDFVRKSPPLPTSAA